jgi:hypothetical protein
VAIPVLMRAQADSDRGALSAERRARLKEGFSRMLDNLLEDSLPEADTAEEREEIGAEGGPVVCIAGRNELDETAALLLAHLLHLRGRAAQVFSADALTDGRALFVLKDAAVVCLSLLSTSAPARARHLVRRVRRRAPRARLILGFWALQPEQLSIADAAADAVSTSLSDAVTDIEAGAGAPRSPQSALDQAAC